MATTTAIILVGHAHQNDSGIIPEYIIQLTENDRPALILQPIGKTETSIIIPTTENTINDLFLLIAAIVLKQTDLAQKIKINSKESMYDIMSESELEGLYNVAKNQIKNSGLKVVFNILDKSHLLNQISIIEQYDCDFEVTSPYLKREYDRWSGKTNTFSN